MRPPPRLRAFAPSTIHRSDVPWPLTRQCAPSAEQSSSRPARRRAGAGSKPTRVTRRVQGPAQEAPAAVWLMGRLGHGAAEAGVGTRLAAASAEDAVLPC